MSAPIAKAVAKVLSEEPIDVSAPSASQRQRALSAVRAQLAANAQTRARRRWIFRAGAAAAVVLVGVGGWKVATRKPTDSVSIAPSTHAPREDIFAESVHGSVFVVTDNERRALASLEGLVNGQSIVTDDGEATIGMRGGSRVRIEPRSDASVSDDHDTHLVRVKMGGVVAMVAKLGAAERFLVRTDEAEVEAHGTVFKVTRAMQSECGARTLVHVIEGRIAIRDGHGERFLNDREDWTSSCPTIAPPAVTSVTSAPSHASMIAPQRPLAPPTPTEPQPPISPVPVVPTATQEPPAPPATTPTTTPATTPSITPYPEFGRRK